MLFCIYVSITALPPPAFFVLFFFYCSGDHPDLHSFPTRRSSDLASASKPPSAPSSPMRRPACPVSDRRATTRSEEHTSELQSLRHLVCRLLLEKKKKKKNKNKNHNQNKKK